MSLLDYFRSQQESGIALLKELVELESHSLDKAGVDRLADFLGSRFRDLGADVSLLRQESRGNVLKALWKSGRPGKPILLLGHMDTVWPAGTTGERPFRLEGGKAYGPGVFDMKGGLLVSLLVCRAMCDRLLEPAVDVAFFFSSDEEIGTEASLPCLRIEAQACRAVLCLEPPLPGGKAKTFRKGVGVFKMRVEGVAAHAGVDHQKGANAIIELARQAVQIQNLTDYARGITVNVGTFRGGAASNVVPPLAQADIDFRFSTRSDGLRIEEQIRSVRPFDSRCRIEVAGGINRPPLERTPEVVGLYLRARQEAESLGMTLGEGGTGGGSDGSFTADMGIPTLDGLGVEGDGAHAAHEFISVHDIPRRAALIGSLLQSLSLDDGA
jgi:glutamate carboxypeptidase